MREKAGWQELLRAWSTGSHFLRTNSTTRYISPRGLEQLLLDLKTIDKEFYAATGISSTAAYKSSADLDTAMLYAINLESLVNKLNLRQTNRGATVILGYPNSAGSFQTSSEFRGRRIVAMDYSNSLTAWARGFE